MMIRYEIEKLREKVLTWIAWKLPRPVAYWATIRVATFNYDGNPGERSVLDALNGFGRGHDA